MQTMKRINVYVEPELHTRAKVVAARMGCDVSSLVRDAIAKMIERCEAEVEARDAKQEK
ncbi:hypothetical protein [Paraburkholderia sp. A1RO-5L]|uniref:hypothetical protein n=1 Tax=Paraburkholderia sp. A1RO-5L TaxID=3028370 RepID=UPI003B77BC31